MSEYRPPLVSIVIPVFNAVTTLDRLMKSVLKQSYRDIQIVIVDDGSTDGTLKKARDYAAGDQRILVLTQENAGVSAARNLGLRSCMGEYIRFADGDDCLPEDSVQKMLDGMRENQVDLVIGTYREHFGSICRLRDLSGDKKTVSRDEALCYFHRQANSIYYGVLWNKLFRRDLIEKGGLLFEDGLTYGEDFAFVADYLAYAGRLYYITDPVYDYIRNEGSLTVCQARECLIHPLKNIRTKLRLYHHLQALYRNCGRYEETRHTLWLYLLRVGF